MFNFKKWDILFIPKFPEMIQCSNSRCGRNFSISNYSCPYCGADNLISNIVSKSRPIILWLDQSYWFQSMAFAIPLSKSRIYSDRLNEVIKLTDYQFLHTDTIYREPMRAIIHQSTRIDGNVLSNNRIIGKITNRVSQDKIENKLLNWIFP